MRRIMKSDELRFARLIPVGAPTWLGDDIPISTPELTRVRQSYCFSPPWKPRSLRIRACIGLMQRWPPETITSSVGLWPWRGRTCTHSPLPQPPGMCGWDYGWSGVGTTPPPSAPLGLRLTRANS